MKQGVVYALIGVVVVLGLAVGYLLGQGGSPGAAAAVWRQESEKLGQQIERLTQELGALEERVAGLEGKLTAPQAQASTGAEGAAGAGLKIAYVDMFKVLQELQDSPLVKQALEQFRAEQQKIQEELAEWEKKFNEGEITKRQLDEKRFELELRLREINLQLSAPIQKEMLEIIRQIGQEKGYGLIIDNPASQLNAIVLYSQAGQADDITQEVIQRLSARLQEEQQDQGEAEGDGSSSKSEGE